MSISGVNRHSINKTGQMTSSPSEGKRKTVVNLMHTQPDIKSFDRSAFRKALSCFPTGVGVATILSADRQPNGMTISSFNSVSMDPPLILWSIGLEAACIDDFRQAEAFAINILAADQKPISQQFAQAKRDRFSGLTWHLSPTGLPLLDGAAATLSCKVWNRFPGGDHEIIVGEVYELSCSDKIPLLYGLGRLTSFPTEL